MLIIIGVLIWGLQKLLAIVPMNEIIRQVVLIVITVLLVIWLVNILMGMFGGYSFPAFSRPILR